MAGSQRSGWARGMRRSATVCGFVLLSAGFGVGQNLVFAPDPAPAAPSWGPEHLAGVCTGAPPVQATTGAAVVTQARVAPSAGTAG